MKFKSQMLNNNRVVGIHDKFKAFQNFKEKGKHYQTKKKRVTPPGHRHVPKLFIVSEIQNQQQCLQRDASTMTNSAMQLHKLIQPMMLKSTQKFSEAFSLESRSHQNTQLKSSSKRPRANIHSDDVFFSGAWLFDLDTAPKWFQREFHTEPKKQIYMNPSEVMKWMSEIEANPMTNVWIPLLTQDELAFETSGSWLFGLNDMPLWFQKEVRSTTQLKKESAEKTIWMPSKSTAIITGTKKELITKSFSFSFSFLPLTQPSYVQHYHENNALDSGAWVLDESVASYWWTSGVCSASHLNNSKVVRNMVFNTFLKELLESFYIYPLGPLNNKKNVETKCIVSGTWLFDLASVSTGVQILIHHNSNSNFTCNDWFNFIHGFSYHAYTGVKKDQVIYLNQVPILNPKLIGHEDIGFNSGVWFLDEKVMPECLKKECFSLMSVPTLKQMHAPFSNAASSVQLKPHHIHQMQQKTSILKIHSSMKSPVITKSLQIHPGKVSYNSRRLFHSNMAPHWFKIAFSTSTATSLPKNLTYSNPVSHFFRTNPTIYQPLPQPFVITSLPTLAHFKLHLNSPLFSLTNSSLRNNQTRKARLSQFKSPLIQYHYTQAEIMEINFETGAWLFDPNRVPEWMSMESIEDLNRDIPPANHPDPDVKHKNRFWEAFKRPFSCIANFFKTFFNERILMNIF